MKEQERADMLSQSIDSLIQGQEVDLKDEELSELLELAKLRKEAAMQARQTGALHQDSAWQKIQSRLAKRDMDN